MQLPAADMGDALRGAQVFRVALQFGMHALAVLRRVLQILALAAQLDMHHHLLRKQCQRRQLRLGQPARFSIDDGQRSERKTVRQQ